MSYHLAGRGSLGQTEGAALTALATAAKKIDPTYASKAVSAINTLTTSPLAQQLTPMVRMGANIVDMAYQEMTSLGPSIDTSQLSSMALSLSKQILGLTDSEIAMVGDVAGAVGEAIPIIQAAVSMFESVNAMLSQAQDARIQAAIQDCTSYYRPIVGTGPNIPPKPADIFVSGWTKAIPAQTVTGPTGTVFTIAPAVPAKPIPSSVGAAMIALTECAAAIPAQTRAIFRLLRHAIEESAKDPARTDGGVQIWPVYIDLLRSEFDNGHLSKPYAMSVWHAAFGGGGPLVTYPQGFIPASAVTDDPSQPAFVWIGSTEPQCNLAPGPWAPTPIPQIVAAYKDACSQWAAAACGYHVNCLDIDPRPILGVLQMVDNWRATVQPKWGSDIIALADEQTFIANALAAARAKLGITPAAPKPVASTTPAAKAKASTVLLLSAPTQTSPVVALLLGAAAVGGAFYAIKTIKKHRAVAARRAS